MPFCHGGNFREGLALPAYIYGGTEGPTGTCGDVWSNRPVGYGRHSPGGGVRDGGPARSVRSTMARVVNHRGGVSPRSGGDGARVQRALLEAEGVRFRDNGCMDLERYQWVGRSRKVTHGK